MDSRQSGQYARAVVWSIIIGSVLVGGLWGQPAYAQGEYSYIDKLFGTQFVFTPKADEVMVRLAPAAGKSQGEVLQTLLAQTGLEVVHDEGLAEFRFVVLRTAPGKATTQSLRQLQGLPSVAVAYPAMIDQDGLTRYFLPDQITVQFDDALPERRMLTQIRAMDSRVAIDHWTPGYYTLDLPAGADPFNAVRMFIRMPSVQFAELSFISFNDQAFTPNDTNYPQQWSLHNDGTNATGATADADADLRDAWDIERGDPNIIVAVIDSGTDWDHPDLAQNILINQLEDINGNGVFDNSPAPGGDLDGIDNDGNGRVDDVVGWDFANNDNDPSGGDHGTACAGIVAAEADNNLGVAGAAHGSRIMPLRVNLTAGQNQNRADAINYAVAEAAKYDGLVISASWRASGNLVAIQNAVINARNNEVLPIFAASNFNTSPVDFPARYDETMAVAATSPCDTRKRSSSNAFQVNPGVSTDPLGTSCDGEAWWGSNFGDDLNIGAPGVLMPTTDRVGGLGYGGGDYINNFNGTSSATPLVAGIAALVLSHNQQLSPGSVMTADELEDILESSADKVGGYDYNYDATRPGFSEEIGAGRVNALRALQTLIARTVGAITAPPVDIALSIDRSGSMGPPLASAEKILAAKNAAAQVVRLMNIGDNVAVISYASTATTDFALTEITSEAVKDNAITQIDAIVHGGGTSIGDGLLEARGELITAFPPQTQSIILMSDGQSNTAPYVQPVLDAGILGGTTVYTIGFGTPGFDVDEDTLNAIASQTGGQYFFSGAEGVSKNGVVASDGALTLIKGYQASFQNAAQREILKLLAASFFGEDQMEMVPVDAAVDEMRFSLLWDTRQSNLFQLLLEDPGGTIIDPNEANQNPLIEYIEGATVSSYRVREPKPGLWKMIAQAKQGIDARIHFSAAAYTTCKLVLNLIPRGSRLLIQAKVLIGGVPVRDVVVQALLHTPSGKIVDLRLNDEGEAGDEEKGDGTHSFLFDQREQEPGTYTVEAFAEGVDEEDFAFIRYAVQSSFLGEEEAIGIGLPTLVAIPGALLDLPILVHKWVPPWVKVTQFVADVIFDPAILKPTGEAKTKGTLTEEWDCGTELLSENRLRVSCQGEALEGQGTLVNLPFQVNDEAKPGASSRLVLAQFEQNGEVKTETSNGMFTVGSTLIGQQIARVEKPAGWSLASLPVALPPGVPLSTFFPSFQSAFLFEQGRGYVQTESPEPTEGFWLNLGDEEDATLVGDPVTQYTTMLPAGWSIIGGLSENDAAVTATPRGVLQALFLFVPGRGYVPTDHIPAGEGAWVNCSAPCEVTVAPVDDDQQPGKQSTTRREVMLTVTGTPRSGYVSAGTVVIGTAEAAETLLYPPALPAYTVQARLLDAGGSSEVYYRDLRRAGDAELRWTLEIDPNGSLTDEGEATLRWNAAALRLLADRPWTLREGHGGPVVVEDMRQASSVRFTGREPKVFTISASAVGTGLGDDEMPATFALEANYPNPFNPTTAIRYSMPEAGPVTLRVYNVLGQQVRTLLDGPAEAGRHVITWDGRDDSGAAVPSGTYFYRMEAPGFAQVRTMILLK